MCTCFFFFPFSVYIWTGKFTCSILSSQNLNRISTEDTHTIRPLTIFFSLFVFAIFSNSFVLLFVMILGSAEKLHGITVIKRKRESARARAHARAWEWERDTQIAPLDRYYTIFLNCKLVWHWYYTATHCNTLQRTATHGNVVSLIPVRFTHCSAVQYAATHCNTLQQCLSIAS